MPVAQCLDEETRCVHRLPFHLKLTLLVTITDASGLFQNWHRRALSSSEEANACHEAGESDIQQD